MFCIRLFGCYDVSKEKRSGDLVLYCSGGDTMERMNVE